MPFFRRKSQETPAHQDESYLEPLPGMGLARVQPAMVQPARVQQQDAEIIPEGPVSMQDDGSIVFSVTSVPEAKLAIKQLKLWKKELGFVKREIAAEQKGIRSQYTEQVRQQGSKFRGGGGFGKFIRAVQTSQRDANRRNLSNTLQPYEQRKRDIEARISAVDQTILKIESYLLKNS